MKIRFLGTAGSEGLPVMFCSCSLCTYAREKKGKEIRTRMGMMIDEDLLIDFSPDAYMQSVVHGLDYSTVNTLLVTHSHEDHFYPYDLVFMRSKGASKVRSQDVLHLYSNKEVQAVYNSVSYINDELRRNVQLHLMSDGQTVQAGNYKVTAFVTPHMPTDEGAFIYLIEKDGKKYFHICDSGEPYDAVYEYLEKNQIKLDAVAMDCTYGNFTTNYGGHMNVWQNVKVRDRLKQIGAVTDQTKVCLTHVSHYTGDTYDSLNETALKNGFILAYDGMTIEI